MSESPAALDPSTREALRAEHDALAERLAIRTSVDAARKALYLIFFGLLSVGLSIKLAWDRWGVLKPGVVRKVVRGRPLFLYVAVVVAVLLLLGAIRWFVASRRLMREEDVRYARYRQLRATLGLDT
jgi:hypothetical protein